MEFESERFKLSVFKFNKSKVNLSLSTIWIHRGVEIFLYSFFMLALDGGEHSESLSSRFNPKEKPPVSTQ